MRAGYEVAAVDGFADAQTAALCTHLVAVPFNVRGFDADALLKAMQTFDLKQFVGLLYGSGFEAQPELLHQLAQLIPVLGNQAALVAQLKNPQIFFAALDQLEITHPDWYPIAPERLNSETLNNVLVKAVGGTGGGHIQYVDGAPDMQDYPHYFQQRIEGDAISVLFVADGQQVDIVGFNLQWVNEAPKAPFRFGGIAGNAGLSESVKSQLRYAAEKLTQHFGLLGLNSLDAVISKHDEQLFVLELNPRLSASVELYSGVRSDLLECHIQSCCDVLPKVSPAMTQISNALAVVYAEEERLINTDFVWPEWVKDYPPMHGHGIKINAGEPICTVHATAINAWAAKQLVQERSAVVLELLKQQN